MSSEFLLNMALVGLVATKTWTHVTIEEILTVAGAIGLYTGGRTYLKTRT